MHEGALFVGRDRELAEMLEALDASGSGRGRVFLVGGEPGIGKSRLADELATRARANGHEVLWGRGWDGAGAPAYWPWVQALRAHLRSADPDELRRQLGSGARDIAQMLPELRDRYPDLPAPAEAESASARFQLFDSTVAFLRNAAAAHPLLVILDDLHAADTPSILLLRFVASQMADIPMLLVGTYRDVVLTPDHPLTAAVAEVAREPITRSLLLSGLQPDAVEAMIRSSTESVPHDHLVAAVWRETNGNPLFVGEAVRLLAAEGRLNDVADLPSLTLVVPAGVRAVIARRIENLSKGCGDLLGLGAALGPEFSLVVLRRIADLDVDSAMDLVDEAVQAGLLLPVAGAHGRYRFSHDLVRETLYGELSPKRRARLHQRVAEVIEALFPTAIDAHLAELAFHYVKAVEGGGVATDAGEPIGPRAIDYSRRAGDQAARSLAYEEADRLYRMALAGLDLTDETDERPRTEILLALGEVQARAGDFEGARVTFLLAADAARRTGVGEHLAQAALGYGGRLAWARPGRDTRLIPLLQDALVMLGGGDRRLRVFLLGRLACAWRSSPDRRDDSAALSLQALEIARGLDDLATLSYALAARYWAIWWPENPAERNPIAAEMLAIVEALGDGERLVDAHLLLFMDYSEASRMTEGRLAVDAVTRMAEELRQPAQRWLGVAPRSLLALLDGDFALAEELIPKMLARRLMPSARDDESAGRMQRFLLRREQGRVGEELETVRASVDEFPWYPLHRAALACLLVDIGRDVEAREVFEEMSRDEFRMFYRDSEWLFGICIAAEACALLNDVGAAATLYGQLEPYAGRHAIGHAEGSVAAVDRYLGLLAATLGRLDDAERHLAASVELNTALGARPWTAHAQHDLAVLLRRRGGQGDPARADALDRAARETAVALGMALAERIAPVADETTVPTTAPSPITVGSIESATFRREGEYWTLEFGADTFRVRDAKGMRHLARLLESPGRDVHALELARFEAPVTEQRGVVDPSMTDVGGSDDAGPLLDAEAKAAYRERLRDLQQELAQAEEWNDPERASRLQDESDALTHELAAALGLGGRDRVASSAAERARISVTRAIRSSLTRIGEHSDGLSAHLEATIHTGTFCSYTPDPRAPITWRL